MISSARTRRLALAGTALALLLAACGDAAEDEAGSVTTTSTTAPSATPETPAEPAPPPEPVDPDLPDVTVENLAGGQVNLAGLFPSDKPVLAWLWAPH